MKIAIANDHRGVKAVEQVKAIISELDHECLDFSHNTEQPIDYPDAAYRAASMVSKGQADRAILICSTGIGMSIAANKIKGIKAALCYDELTARVSRSFGRFFGDNGGQKDG
jgi:ribose 5-phosphate isomerase B